MSFNNQPKDNQFAFFNKFQTLFYTSITEFGKFTHFEIKQNSFLLLNNLIKGFPHQATEILDCYSPHVKALESPAIIFALQRKFVNNFSRARVPQHVYFKNMKPKAESKKKVKDTSKGIEFDNDIVAQLQSLLMMDTKTYEYLKYSENVQKLGKQILFEQEKLKEEKVSKALARAKSKNIEL
jgi:hypothetical protein